jgi:hypothetical protein
MQTFNEAEWIKLVFLLADTQAWVDDLARSCFVQLPLDKKKLFKKDYYLTAATMAHIIERHYYKVNRHPQTGKFHIPLLEILEYMRSAYAIDPVPVNGSCNCCRVLDTGTGIGLDKEGSPAPCIAVITDKGGRIDTAFPCTAPGAGNGFPPGGGP